MLARIRWRAVFAGFAVTTLCALGLSPLLARFGLQVQAGPVDMLSMLSILAGGFVAGRVAGRFEGLNGGLVAVLYIFLIRLGGDVMREIGIARISGLAALGKVDSWGNFGQDFFHFVAGALGGLWATPFNERDRARESALLRSTATKRARTTSVITASDADEDTDTVGELTTSSARAKKKTPPTPGI